MARVCNQCKAYDAEGTITTCPTCDLPMQFTMLPPPGQTPAAVPLPVEAEPRPQARRPSSAEQGHQFMDSLGYLFRFRFLLYLLVGPMLAGGYYGFGLGGAEADKAAIDPIGLRSKFDDVQEKLQHPAPIAGFQTSSVSAPVNFQPSPPILAGPATPFIPQAPKINVPAYTPPPPPVRIPGHR